MTTQTNRLAQILSPEAIKNFAETRYNPTMTELYVFREQASHLSDTARSALSACIPGNVHSIFGQLENPIGKTGLEIDPIERRMDEILWNEIVADKLKGNIAPALYAEIYEAHLDGSLHKRFGSPNEKGLTEFVAVFTDAETLLSELKNALDQLKSLMENPHIVVGVKAKLSKGSFAEKAQAIAEAAAIFGKAANHARPHHHVVHCTPAEPANVIKTLQELKDSGDTSETPICSVLNVALYGNGNIDFRITDEAISHIMQTMG